MNALARCSIIANVCLVANVLPCTSKTTNIHINVFELILRQKLIIDDGANMEFKVGIVYWSPMAYPRHGLHRNAFRKCVAKTYGQWPHIGHIHTGLVHDNNMKAAKKLLIKNVIRYFCIFW